MTDFVIGIGAQLILEPIRSIGKGLGDGIKKSDIKSLRRELEMLNRQIDEAERRLEEEESVKALVKQMRELAELIENVLDRYVLMASQPQGFASYLRKAGRLISILSSSNENLAANIRNIKLLLGEIKERGERYNMSEHVTGDVG